MRTGLTLEKEVVQKLPEQDWGVRTDEVLDQRDKIDFIAETRWGNKLPVQGAVQMTMMGGDADKLDWFVKSRVQFPSMAHFYVVVERDMEPSEVVRQMSSMLEWYLIFQPPRPGVHGIFLCKDAWWKSFNPAERIAKLRARANPAANADVRKSGKICLLATNGFRVRCIEDGREYTAFDADAADGPLRSYLKSYRKGEGPSPIGLVVNFVPYKDAEERLRALSVLFNATATTARSP